MDQIKELVQHFTAGIVDFEGQKTSNKYLNILCNGGVILSVITAFVLGDIEMMTTGFAATFVAMVIFSLPIPAYRRHPVKWLPITTSVKAE